MKLEEIIRALKEEGLERVPLEQANAQREFFAPETTPFTEEDMPYWFTFTYKEARVCVEVSDDRCFNLPNEPEEETYHLIQAAVQGLGGGEKAQNLKVEATKRSFGRFLSEAFQLPWPEFENVDVSTAAKDEGTVHRFIECTRALVDTVQTEEYFGLLQEETFFPGKAQLELRKLAHKTRKSYGPYQRAK